MIHTIRMCMIPHHRAVLVVVGVVLVLQLPALPFGLERFWVLYLVAFAGGLVFFFVRIFESVFHRRIRLYDVFACGVGVLFEILFFFDGGFHRGVIPTSGRRVCVGVVFCPSCGLFRAWIGVRAVSMFPGVSLGVFVCASVRFLPSFRSVRHGAVL